MISRKLLPWLILAAFSGIGVGLGISAAYPQAPASGFVPYTIDETRHNSLMAWLGNQPFNVAAPLVNTLNGFEAEAIQKKAWDDCEIAGDAKACEKVKPK